MEKLYKDTVEYCKQREQFGQAIGKFQVLQHRMVDMFMEHEQSKSMMFMAAMRLDEGYGDAAQKAVSAFKVQVGKCSQPPMLLSSPTNVNWCVWQWAVFSASTTHVPWPTGEAPPVPRAFSQLPRRQQWRCHWPPQA